jgi:uncharacterized membrane protein
MTKKIIYWLPRILSLAFVLFLSLFALDVFGEYSGWAAIPALLIHLLPMFILLAFVIAAWKYDLVGLIVFPVFALGYVLLVGLDRHWSWYAAISGPAIIVGFLFFLSWAQKRADKIKK